MSPTPLPRSGQFVWLRRTTLRVGLLTGVYLSMVMGASLFIAGRTDSWDELWGNPLFWALFAMGMLIPVVRFLLSPGQLFASGMCGWFLLAWTYGVTGLFLELPSATFFSPFHLFVLGAGFYGVVAVTGWVASMALAARHRPIVASRRRPY